MNHDTPTPVFFSRNSLGFVAILNTSVREIPDTTEVAPNFGFSAEDIGDYLYDTLQIYGRDFTAIEFMTGDNTYVNGRLALGEETN